MSFAPNLPSGAHATRCARAAHQKQLQSILTAQLTPCFSYSSKLLRQQPFSFDTHANAPGGGMPRSESLLPSSLSCQRRKCNSFISNTFRTLAQKHPCGTPSHPFNRIQLSASSLQSLLCFSGFFLLSGITRVPEGASPVFRALRLASVPASSIFLLFFIASPLIQSVYIRFIKRNYIAPMTLRLSYLLLFVSVLLASATIAQQSPVQLPNGKLLGEVPGNPRAINNLPTAAALSPD